MAKMWNSRSLSALQDRYYALSKREQLVVLAGTLAVTLFLLAGLVFLPTYDRLNSLEGTVKAKERDLIELKALSLRYRHLENGRSAAEKPKGESLSLFSVLEKLATESGLMEKIEYMRPGSLQLDPGREEKWVEVKLGRVTLKEFTDYLSRIQSFGGGIYIKRLAARKEGEYLSLILQPAVVEAK
jgi:type II secretory pathway component PulM